MPPARLGQTTVEVIGELAGCMVGEMVTVAVGVGVGVALLFIAY
jgi:outer membrane lipoprotein SlyB